MARITDLPVEVLLHIFRIYLETETQKNLLKVIAKVCVSWRDVCFEKFLWAKYDGTLRFKDMMKFSREGRLSNTKELILSKTDILESTDGDELFKGAKNIEIIAFSKVKQISEETLSILAQNCPKIKKIQIGRRSKKPLKLNYEMLVSFFPARGSGIVKVNLSYCKLTKLTKSVRCISDCCPNLQYLHLMYINSTLSEATFPTAYVQMHCPKLKGLYLDQSVKLQKNKHPSGFPDLEEFAYHDTLGRTFNDELFECVLFNSPEIKFLSLTNCCNSASFLNLLPCCSVEYLYLSRSKACSSKPLCDVLKKWSHSLKEVDISYGTSFVHRAILNLVTTPAESPLEFLNLNFTITTLDLVEKIIRNCKHLETLKLEGCRNIKRGMKRTYSNKSEIAELSEKVKIYMDNHPCEVCCDTSGDTMN